MCAFDQDQPTSSPPVNALAQPDGLLNAGQKLSVIERAFRKIRTGFFGTGTEQRVARTSHGNNWQLSRAPCRWLPERDELGISQFTTARPIRAAVTSALSFSVGAAMLLLAVIVSPATDVVTSLSESSLAYLEMLGAIGARAGGAGVAKATVRLILWGALAMAVTAGIGMIIGKAV